MFISLYDVYCLIPEVYLLICSCVLLIYGVFFSTSISKGFPLLTTNVGWLSLQVVLFTFLLIILLPDFNFLNWNYLLVTDPFSYGAKVILTLTFIVWFFLSLTYVQQEKLNSFEYWIISLLGLAGMYFVLQANDFMSLYLSVEFQSLTFYVLTSFKRSSEFSTESGLKYFILGAFSSALLLFGLSLLYSLTGLTNLTDYARFFSGFEVDTYGAVVGLLFICTSLLFKLSAAPFHMWSPDVYEGAPTAVTAYLSILPKLGVITILSRLCFFTFHYNYSFWQPIILVSAYLSIFIGTFSAFYQKKIKRFIAYSSISHIGFFLIGFIGADTESFFSIVFYFLAYLIMSISIFFLVTSFRYFQYPNHFQVRWINDFSGLGQMNPILAFSLTLIVFSMAGIPPLIGFFAKLFVLLAAIQNQFYSLSVVAVLVSCVGCFYYIRFIKLMYFENLATWKVLYPINKINSIFLGCLCFIIAFLFLDLETCSMFVTFMSLSFLG